MDTCAWWPHLGSRAVVGDRWIRVPGGPTRVMHITGGSSLAGRQMEVCTTAPCRFPSLIQHRQIITVRSVGSGVRMSETSTCAKSQPRPPHFAQV